MAVDKNTIKVDVVKGENNDETVVEQQQQKNAGEENNNEQEGQQQEDKQEQKQEQIDNNKQEQQENDEEAKKLEAEQAAAKTQKEKDRIQRRIDKLTAKNDELAKENEDLKKQLAAKPKEGLSEEEVDRRASVKANEQTTQRQFADSCNRLFKDATKVDKDFKKKIDSVVEDLGGVEVGGIPGSMIGILDDLDNGGAVLSHLADNIDDYEEIRELPLAKMAARLSKISAQLEEAAKKKPTPRSKVPAPMEGIGGQNLNSNVVITGNENMDEYARKRAIQREERRKQRLAMGR